ncbi:MAG TPA: hypothetical protein VN672_03370 [Solirubrobacteraceae bacterium]|nr:hypothetical protein [Solirubrobacteraceae bacterium]
MPRVIVTSDPPEPDAPVMLDETVATVHVGDKHACDQLIQRIVWAIEDAERVEAHVGDR